MNQDYRLWAPFPGGVTSEQGKSPQSSKWAKLENKAYFNIAHEQATNSVFTGTSEVNSLTKPKREL